MGGALAEASGIAVRVKCVRIACNGESNQHINYLEEYDLLSDHDVFTLGEVSPMSQLVGIPLTLVRAMPSRIQEPYRRRNPDDKPAAPRYSHDQSARFYPNAMARELMRCAEGAASELLSTPGQWTERVGSVLVARVDGKDLFAHHVSVLADYICRIVDPIPEEDLPVLGLQMIQLITPHGFIMHYNAAYEHSLHAAVQSPTDSGNLKTSLSDIPFPFEVPAAQCNSPAHALPTANGVSQVEASSFATVPAAPSSVFARTSGYNGQKSVEDLFANMTISSKSDERRLKSDTLSAAQKSTKNQTKTASMQGVSKDKDAPQTARGRTLVRTDSEQTDNLSMLEQNNKMGVLELLHAKVVNPPARASNDAKVKLSPAERGKDFNPDGQWAEYL